MRCPTLFAAPPRYASALNSNCRIKAEHKNGNSHLNQAGGTKNRDSIAAAPIALQHNGLGSLDRDEQALGAFAAVIHCRNRDLHE